MQHFLTPYAKQTPPFAWWEGAFTEQELNWLQEKAKLANQNAGIGSVGAPVVDHAVRRSYISWLENNPNSKFVFEKLGQITVKLNAEHFGFDLVGFGEALQLTNYDQSEQGMYGWHQDYNNPLVSRKLSLVVQLTDPSEYEGGNLQIKVNAGEPITVRKQRGFIAVFPSYTLHQVTPVTQGNRQSLVAWISGPPFK